VKIVSLDIGTVRIGIASSDIMEIIASPSPVYRRKNNSSDVQNIANIVNSLEAGQVVIGLPLKMDERLSTVEAQRILIESGMRREKRKDKIDSLAATIILQTYLDKKSNMIK